MADEKLVQDKADLEVAQPSGSLSGNVSRFGQLLSNNKWLVVIGVALIVAVAAAGVAAGVVVSSNNRNNGSGGILAAPPFPIPPASPSPSPDLPQPSSPPSSTPEAAPASPPSPAGEPPALGPTLAPPPPNPEPSPPPPEPFPPPPPPEPVLSPPPPPEPVLSPPPPPQSPHPPPPSPPPPSPPPPSVTPQPPAGWTTLWSEEFNGGSLDTSKWTFDLGRGDWGWGNNEKQVYTDYPDNVRVEGGNLLITAMKLGDGTITSARINTRDSAAFVPGMVGPDGKVYNTLRVEGRLQQPIPGQGFWPAFWLLSRDNKYGPWPFSGEIDLAETINAMMEITHALHYGGSGPNWVLKYKTTRKPGGGTWGASGFHTYAVEWSADTMQFFIDDQLTWVQRSRASQGGGDGWFSLGPGAGPNSPFDQPFYIILNFAIGGNFPKDPDDTTPFPATMMVDYVRVFGRP